MKILVTGASGGLGRSVVTALLERGHHVIATARRNESPFDLPPHRLTWKPYDLGSGAAANLFTFFDRPDALVHLAWDKLNNHASPDHETTILETQKVFLENLVANGLRDLTVAGTCYEYGLKEGELREDDPAAPVISYAKGKVKLYEFLNQLANKKPFTLKWLRIFNVFSPGKEGKNLFSLLSGAIERGDPAFPMSGGEQVRDYLNAAQVADIISQAAEQSRVTGIINCCSGKPRKLKELVATYIAKRGSTLAPLLGHYPYLKHEPMSHWGNTDKLSQVDTQGVHLQDPLEYGR